KLGPGDVIQVTVAPQHGPYDLTLPVQPDGRFFYPVVGEVIAAGKTIPQVRQILQDGLSRELRNHTVTVSLVRAREGPVRPPEGAAGRVVVLGSVKQPVAFNWEENMRLTEAMVKAGGPNPTADLSRITITRDDLSSVTVDFTTLAGRSFLIRPGDVV